MSPDKMWKLPPKAKIYEALTALADGRVEFFGTHSARVVSSSRDRSYEVRWSDGMRTITANDNASHWQGYMGYPIIAVLLKAGAIPYSSQIAEMLRGIPWKDLNERFKRNYDKAVEYILQHLDGGDDARAAIIREVDSIFDALGRLDLRRGPRLPCPAARDTSNPPPDQSENPA